MLIKIKFTFEDSRLSEKLMGELNGKLIDMNTYSYLVTHNPQKPNNYIFTPKSKTWVYHNSFIPIIYLYKDAAKQINVIYRLQFAVRLALLIIMSLAMLFELAFLGLCLCGFMYFNIARLLSNKSPS